jgi:hypothetical protein
MSSGRFRKVPGGFGRLWEVQEGSVRFYKVLRVLQGFVWLCKVLRGFGRGVEG